jgi:hypothetical protein
MTLLQIHIVCSHFEYNHSLSESSNKTNPYIQHHVELDRFTAMQPLRLPWPTHPSLVLPSPSLAIY